MEVPKKRTGKMDKKRKERPWVIWDCLYVEEVSNVGNNNINLQSAKNSKDDSDYNVHVNKACIDSASFVKTLLNDLSKHDVHKNK